MNCVKQRCLYTTETKIETPFLELGFREGNGLPIALSSQAIDGGPSRIFQPQHLRTLVKGLPCRIVFGRAQEPTVTEWVLEVEMSMASRHHEDHTRERE